MRIRFVIFYILISGTCIAQDPNYLEGEFPTKAITDTLTFNGTLKYNKLFFSTAENFKSGAIFSDTVKYRTDSSLFTGTIAINFWAEPFPDGSINSSTHYFVFDKGLNVNYTIERYAFTAYYDKHGSIDFHFNKDQCYVTDQISKPDSISSSRVYESESETNFQADKIKIIEYKTFYSDGALNSIQKTKLKFIDSTDTYENLMDMNLKLYQNGDTTRYEITQDQITFIKHFDYYNDQLVTYSISLAKEEVFDISEINAIYAGIKDKVISESDFILQLNQSNTRYFFVFPLDDENRALTGYDAIIFSTGLSDFNPEKSNELKKFIKNVIKSQTT